MCPGVLGLVGGADLLTLDKGSTLATVPIFYYGVSIATLAVVIAIFRY